MFSFSEERVAPFPPKEGIIGAGASGTGLALHECTSEDRKQPAISFTRRMVQSSDAEPEIAALHRLGGIRRLRLRLSPHSLELSRQKLL